MKFKNLILFFSLFMLLLISCKKNSSEKIKADLTFRSISFASAYDADKKQYDRLIKNIDGKENQKIKLSKYFSKLKKYNLLKSPYIFLHFGGDSIMAVYLSENEYKKVKNIKHVDLHKENKKIVLELEIEKKDNNIYYSNKIFKVSKVDGKSRSNIYKNANK